MRWASSTSPTPRRGSSTPAPSSASRGTGKFDGNLVEIGWRELFGAKVPFRRRYDLKGTVPASLVAKAGFPPVEPYVTGPDRHDAALPGGDQRHERGGRPLRHQGRQGRSCRRSAGPRSRAPTARSLLTLKLAAGGKLTTIDFEGRANGLSGQGPGALRRRQRRAAGHAAADQDRADRRCRRLEARPGRRRALAARARRSSCRACGHDEVARRTGGQGAGEARRPRRAATPR